VTHCGGGRVSKINSAGGKLLAHTAIVKMKLNFYGLKLGLVVVLLLVLSPRAQKYVCMWSAYGFGLAFWYFDLSAVRFN